MEYYKGDEHPSREAFFQGSDEADCDDEEGGFGPTNEGGSSSKGGNSSSTAVGEEFILPESWRQELLAQIEEDEKTIPHDLLLWEA